MSLLFRARFMMVVACAFFIYALLWATAPYDVINLPARLILDISDWPLDQMGLPLNRDVQWLSSISAGLLAAVSVFLIGIVVPAIRVGNMRVIRTTIVAMVAWYLIDSIGSIAAGVSFNAILNTLYLILVLMPLVCMKSILS